MAIHNTHDQNGVETLEFFIEDSRYGVPSLHLLKCATDGVAAMAERLLRQLPHCRSIEVRRRGQVIHQARRHLITPNVADEPGPA